MPNMNPYFSANAMGDISPQKIGYVQQQGYKEPIMDPHVARMGNMQIKMTN